MSRKVYISKLHLGNIYTSTKNILQIIQFHRAGDSQVGPLFFILSIIFYTSLFRFFQILFSPQFFQDSFSELSILYSLIIHNFSLFKNKNMRDIFFGEKEVSKNLFFPLLHHYRLHREDSNPGLQSGGPTAFAAAHRQDVCDMVGGYKSCYNLKNN